MTSKRKEEDTTRRNLQFARNLDWNLLKFFHEIAEARSVTGAAQELNRKQPALSLALRRLEERLGVTLCQRGPTGFELTDEGRILAEACRGFSRCDPRDSRAGWRTSRPRFGAICGSCW